MTIKNVREWLEMVPIEFDEFQLVFREFKDFKDSENYMAKDTPIVTLSIDEENQEACMFSQKGHDLTTTNLN